MNMEYVWSRLLQKFFSNVDIIFVQSGQIDRAYFYFVPSIRGFFFQENLLFREIFEVFIAHEMSTQTE